MLLIPAYAKVNLCLAVRRRRSDAFHDIDSVVATIDWHDLVGVRLRPAEVTSVRLRLGGDTRDLPSADANLAAAAARVVAAVAGPLDIELWLDKRIPSAAGLGGGSADAAAVLRACAALLTAEAFGTERAAVLDHQTLIGLGASLGSDVPVLIRGGVTRARGRGELLTALAAPPLHLAVAVAGSGSTAAAYAAVEAIDFEDATRAAAVASTLERGETLDDDLLGSGLEPAACRANADLDERLLALRAAVSEARWHMTGSGGAAFALAASAGHAAELADAAVAAGFPARACRSVSG
jgi:4-diphosphocytidyl-2-C-methyl-D-erythritol kinase